MLAREAVSTLWEAIDAARLVRLAGRIARFDRYQASGGIEAAADLVAAEAERSGLRDVEVHRWSPGASPGWWTFDAPAAWTPGDASLRVRAGGETVVSLRYPAQPYRLAANSAPTPPGGIAGALLRERALPAGGPPPGSIVLTDVRGQPDPATVRSFTERGVAAWLGCPTLPSPDAPAGAAGRLELPGGSPLRAFSLSRREFERLRAVPGPGQAEVAVHAAATGRMPLVTGVLHAGQPDGGEILLQAHLCHPAPGADDNAAGVAALVEIAAALARLRRPLRHGVRFLWAPEFAGTAAYLHDLVEHGPLPAPAAVVNLDLVAQPQHEGGPIVVDPAPDHVGDPVTAVAEHCLELLPPSRRSYSGGCGLHDWGWATVGSTGASDHVLFADRHVSVPAIQLGHVPGPRHHTSADTVDRLDGQEARRVAVAAAATAAILAGATPADGGWLAGLVLRSAWRRLLRLARDAGDGGVGGDGVGGGDGQASEVVDPRDPRLRGALRDHLVTALGTDLRAVGAFTSPGPALDARARRFGDAACDLLAPAGAPTPTAGAPTPAAAADRASVRSALADRRHEARHEPDGPVLRRCWPGPFNLRAALGAVTAPRRELLEGWLAADRAGAYTAMTALAQALDGRSPEGEVLRRAAFTTGLRLPAAHARAFLDSLREAGWIAEAPPAA